MNDKKDVLSFKDIISNISDVLAEADGEYLANIYNSICSDKIKYSGDSLFQRV